MTQSRILRPIAMKTKYLLLLIILGICSTINAQTTYVPDDNFEQALIDLGYDDVLDDYVITANINTLTSLYVNYKNISDLTGIEGFTALKTLYCYYNQLSSLDVSKNTALAYLACYSNQLTSLDISNSTVLRHLDCSNNQLTSLDVSFNTSLQTFECHNNQLTGLDVSNNTSLTQFQCHFNQLTTLNVSQNTALTLLGCSDNQLTNLDVTNNPALTQILFGNNQFTSLDLSNCTALEYIYCQNNQLASIDVSNNSALVYLNIGDNQLTSLDISNNTALTQLFCSQNQLTNLDISNNIIITLIVCQGNLLSNLDLSKNSELIEFVCDDNLLTSLDLSNSTELRLLACTNNQLTSLNIQNGNNINFFIDLAAQSNPNLTCIQVDDAAWSTANWTNIDAIASFSEDCSADLTYVPDNNFEQALIDLGYDDVLDNYILTSEITNISYLDLNNRSIINLVGIEAFTSLKYLYCSNNQLTSLDVSNNTALEVLDCSRNQIINLDVTNNIALSLLLCETNNLTSLDVSDNTVLGRLNCSGNQITSLNVSNNPTLTSLSCSANNLTSLDVSSNNALTILRCVNNQISSLNVSNNSSLITLECSINQLTSLDISHNPDLTLLNFFQNQIISLDASNNNALTRFFGNSNSLISLYINNGNNSIINTFNVTNNPNLTCIQVDNVAWSIANWTNIDPASSFSEDCGYDTDSDGVNDIDDDFPNNPDKAFINHFPAASYGSLAFEDLWPAKGDYDFNDVVVDYRFETVTNAQDKVVYITATFIAKACGAGYQNGFGFNLPTANSGLKIEMSVTGSDLRESYIVDGDGNGLEDGQDHPTIIVFDNIFNLLPHPGQGLGVNTEAGSPFVPFNTITVVMTPTQDTYDANDFNLVDWNPFIIVNMDRNVEVHLKDKAPTTLADQTLFGTFDDDSNSGIGRYYVTPNNLPWAIDIPSSFDWPKEKVDISWAYLHFIEWAESLGIDYNQWYLSTQGYRNNSNIYEVPTP